MRDEGIGLVESISVFNVLCVWKFLKHGDLRNISKQHLSAVLSKCVILNGYAIRESFPLIAIKIRSKMHLEMHFNEFPLLRNCKIVFIS